jgi:glycerol kinase
MIAGITRGTTAAHIARATLDAIAFQVRDVVDLIVHEAHVDLPELAVDGGAAASDVLCQLQADQLGVAVVRPEIIETTGLGAAFLAGLGAGIWSSADDLRAARRIDRRFEPGPRDQVAHRQWRAAVERSRGWASDR